MKGLTGVLCLVVVAHAAVINVLTPPPYWAELSDAVDPQERIVVQVALFSQNKNSEADLDSLLLARYSPSSAEYGIPITHEMIKNIVTAGESNIELVSSYFVSRGVEIISVGVMGDIMKIKASVMTLETLFDTKISAYSHKEKTHKIIYRMKDSYVVPNEIDHVVKFLPGANYFPTLRSKVHRLVTSAAVSGQTPSSIGKLYNVTFPTSTANKRSSQAPVEFDDSFYSATDLQTFFKDFEATLEGQQITMIYGPERSSPISIEANLDTQYIMSMGAFVNTTLYSFGLGKDIIDQFIDYADLVLKQVDPPLAQSISFGEYGGHYDNKTVQQFNSALAQVTALGVTVLVASGDIGVGCSPTGDSLEPPFPTSPYCTLCGATAVEQSGEEIGAKLSSGGFSNDYWAPSWQQAAIAGYFASGVNFPTQKYNKNGRGFPDVSSVGVDVSIVERGKITVVGGTSCAAPVVAGIISLLNNYRLNANKTPMGFINPFIYSNPSLFIDITKGSNPYEKCDGFQCAVGWDAVTGLGAPNFGNLLQAAMQLP